MERNIYPPEPYMFAPSGRMVKQSDLIGTGTMHLLDAGISMESAKPWSDMWAEEYNIEWRSLPTVDIIDRANRRYVELVRAINTTSDPFLGELILYGDWSGTAGQEEVDNMQIALQSVRTLSTVRIDRYYLNMQNDPAKRVSVPLGGNNYIDSCRAADPGLRENIDKYRLSFDVLTEINTRLRLWSQDQSESQQVAVNGTTSGASQNLVGVVQAAFGLSWNPNIIGAVANLVEAAARFFNQAWSSEDQEFGKMLLVKNLKRTQQAGAFVKSYSIQFISVYGKISDWQRAGLCSSSSGRDARINTNYRLYTMDFRTLAAISNSLTDAEKQQLRDTYNSLLNEGLEGKTNA